MIRFATACAFALTLGSTGIAFADSSAPMLPPQPAVHPAGIPQDALMVSPCVATMGEHWANLKNLPMGPIYGTWQGKPVFTEIMVPLTTLQQGFSYSNIHALPGYAIDHVDVAFEPTGHPGLTVPHYDIHAYYVSVETQKAICPDGIPDSAMKPTNASHPFGSSF